MHLNHLNLGVSELPATVSMFETYFGLHRIANAPSNQKMAFMKDDSGMLLSLFKVEDANYPKIFHIGFIQPSVADVMAMHEKLKARGFDPEEPREEHGRFTFYFKAPGGFMVEVNTLAFGNPKIYAKQVNV